MNLLFSATLLELFIGGGGRLLEVGPLTVRMLLFATCLLVGLVYAIRRVNRDEGMVLAFGLVLVYLLLHVNAVLIGLFRGYPLGLMMQELQQSLYWLIAPFFAVVLSKRAMVVRSAELVQVAGVVLALAYIGVVILFALGAIDFMAAYVLLNASGEFIFRTGGFFFYKGFLYLGIAAIFFLAMPRPRSWIWLVLVLVALAMTLTRGFVLATAVAAFFLLVQQRRWRALAAILLAIVLVGVFMWGYMPSQDESFAAGRATSNDQRIDDFIFFTDRFDLRTVLLGNGFGESINGRSNIENSFLWAYWRLGLAGILFWCAPFGLSLRYFLQIGKDSPNIHMACAFFFSTIFVYVQTMSNPYLNNPIGLSFVMVALFSLRTLARDGHGSAVPAPWGAPRSVA